MFLRKDAVKIFFILALQPVHDAFGFMPSSCRTQTCWGITHQTKANFLQTSLAVSSSPEKNAVEDDVEEYNFDEDDEEEYDYDELLSKKEQWMQDLKRLSRSSSQDPKAVGKAQAIFDEMFEAYVLTEESSLWPSVDVYNLLLETHAYSKSEGGAEEAEKILSRMEDDSIEFIARPNLETYLNVMDAWAMRKNPERAQTILERFEKRHDETGDESLKPAVEAYNKLIKAYGIAGDAEKAKSIFRDLLEKGGEHKANYKSWVQTMKAYAPLKDGTEQVQSLFEEMKKAFRMGEEEYLQKTDAYNVLIRALAQKADGAEKTEAMLFEMIERFRDGDEYLRPNADTFRTVIAAQQRRKQVSGAKVEQLLNIQEGLFATTKKDDLKLDGRTYNLALKVIARARDSNKAIRAKRIFDKMKVDGENPSVRSYYTLLSACAYTVGNPAENMEAFQLAIDTLKELRESLDREPDNACFGMFLKACGNLMPENKKRDAVVESVFQKCCSDGLVNDFVLNEFERASSEALQLEILGGFLEDGVRLPEEWSRNV